MKRTIWILLLNLWSLTVHAETSSLEADISYRAVGEARQWQTQEGLWNPEGQVIPLPDRTLLLSLRPDLSFRYLSLQLDLRPRLFWQRLEKQELGQEQREIVWQRVLLSQNFDAVQISYGLENFQWSPGELAAPTQVWSQETALDRVGYAESPVQQQARVNVSLGEILSLVLMARPSGSFFKSPQETRAFLLKLELRDPDGKGWIGFVGEKSEEQPTHLGAYGQWELWSASFVYADFLRAQSQKASDRGEQRGADLLGWRYNFESGADLRAEYYRLQAGVTDWDAQRDFLRALPPASRLAVLQGSTSQALSLTGHEYAYTSLRVPRLWQTQFDWQGRILHALSDPSSLAGMRIDRAIGDHVELCLEGWLAFGKKDQDLTRAFQDFFVLAIKSSY